jgi:hypothetical protein
LVFIRKWKYLLTAKKQIRNTQVKRGVMGISEEDGILYGYSIKLYDEEYLLSFDKDEVIPTGKQFTQDDFY